MTAKVERRLAAILAADVVGYSRLMGEDEAGTLARLTAVRKELTEPPLAEHRGRVVKLMGDGVLCEFPSVVDAVACAVAIQRGMAGREVDAPEALPELPAWQAAACAHLGRDEEAKRHAERFAAAAEALWMGPEGSGRGGYLRWLLRVNPSRRQADLDHFIGGLRAAGLPA